MNSNNIKGAAQQAIASFYEQIDSKIDVILDLDGQKYEIERFQIVFGQPVDHKGQPQHEAKGGQFIVTITQNLPDSIYDWAKRANKLKTGAVKFVSETSESPLEISFIDASCISLSHKVNAFSGTETTMVISPRIVSLNGVTHDNRWTGL